MRPVARRIRGLAATGIAIAVAIAVAGCGLLPVRAPAGATVTAPAPPAVGSTAPRNPASGNPASGASDAVPVVRRFARAYINWTAADVASRLDALARTSVGQARSMLELEAQETRRDRALHRGGIGNSGAVEAVTPLPGSPRQYIVVTRERTVAARSGAYRGLPTSWHVAVARVRRVRVAARRAGGGWTVSGWQPES